MKSNVWCQNYTRTWNYFFPINSKRCTGFDSCTCWLIFHLLYAQVVCVNLNSIYNTEYTYTLFYILLFYFKLWILLVIWLLFFSILPCLPANNDEVMWIRPRISKYVKYILCIWIYKYVVPVYCCYCNEVIIYARSS